MKKLLLVALGCMAMLGAKAQQMDLMQAVPNDTQVRTGTLESGIKYYIRSNKTDAQRANFHIVYDVGAIQEEDRQDGLAHFLEHMAFNGSKNFPDNQLIDYLQSIGVAFGENLNAGTGQQMTTYMITNVPITREAIVDSVLLVLHDWAGFISLNGDDIDKERGVIQEEWRLYEAMASQRASRKETAALFGADNLYARRDIIGSMENLKTFTYEDIRDFYQKWYRPDMQAFVIVGDFDVDQMEAKLKATMADIKAHDVKTPKNKVTVDANDQPRFAVITDPELTSTELTVNYRLAPMAEKYNNTGLKFKTDAIVNLFSLMANDRLSNIAKSEDAPFQTAYTYCTGYYEPFDLLVFSAKAREGEAARSFTALYTEVLRMARGGFVEAELDRAKTNMLAEAEKAYNNRAERRNEDYTDQLVENFVDNTPYPSAETEWELLQSTLQGITVDEVNAEVAAMITPKNNVITLTAQQKEGVALPSKADLLALYTDVDGSTIEPYTENVVARPLLDVSKLKGSPVVKTADGKFGSTEWTLKNGIKVVVKPTTFKSDEVVLHSTKLGGSSTIESLEDLYSIGLWNVYESVAGLSDFSDTELRRALTGKNAELSPYVDKITAGYDGKSTVKDLETMFSQMYLYATAPRWDNAAWALMMDKLSTQVKGAEKDPMRIFRDSMAMTQSGGNPRAAQLSEKMLSMASLERMKSTYQQMFASTGGMTFIITGSVNLDSLRPLVEKYIGSMPIAKKAKKPAVGPYIVEPAKGRVVNRFVTPQETPRVIAVTMFNGDIENFSLAEKLNLQVVGEVLNTVYLRTIREEKGGTYVMQNMMEVVSEPRPLAVDVALFLTDTSKVDELLPLIDSGVMDMCKNGPSADNMNKATENFAKKFAENNIQNSTWSGYLTRWYLYGKDNYTDYLEVLKGVNVESVRQAALRLFDQNNKITLVQLP